MKRAKRMYLTAVSVLLILPLQSQAVLISSSIGDYDATTIAGSFDNLSGTLTSQVWWGSEALAVEFTSLVGDALGAPNSRGTAGPFFALCIGWECWHEHPLVGLMVQGPALWIPSLSLTGFTASPSSELTWAIAQPVSVPEPATIWLLLGSSFSLLLLRRRTRARKARLRRARF
jgi:hypothetical protein